MQTMINIPQNPTNGDMIKVIFPKAEIYDRSCYDEQVDIVVYGKTITVSADWWYTPYKRSNGDMIKAMFPNYESRYDAEYEIITGHLDKTHRHNFDLDWWNAPYKKEIG